MSASSLIVDNVAMHMQSQNAQEARARMSRVHGPEPRLGAPRPVDKEKKLREACEGFESIFIQKMWEQMRATVPKSGLMQSREEHVWQGMFDQELAKKMASAGGIGLADMMYEQLSRDLVSASRAAASSQGGKGSGFSIPAAPLVPEQAPIAAGENPARNEAANSPAVQRAPVGHADVYAGAAPQPEAPAAAEGAIPRQAHNPTAAGSPAEDAAPVVRQALAELRRRTEPGGPGGAAAPISARPGNVAVAGQQASVPVGEGEAGVFPAQSLLPPQFMMERTRENSPAPTAPAVHPATGAGQPAPTVPENGRRPEIVTTTFTTNIPPKKRGTRRNLAPRPPSNQPLIRVLGDAPASPAATGPRAAREPAQAPARATPAGSPTPGGERI